MSYYHFTTFERGWIQELLIVGYPHKESQKKLNRHYSTNKREVSRNICDTSYIWRNCTVLLSFSPYAL